jgi:endonuclease-3
VKGERVKAKRNVKSSRAQAPMKVKRAKATGAKKTSSKPTTKPKTGARPKARRSRESRTTRRQRAFRILAALKQAYPQVECALRHGSALELLVATILSAQCTDERVNMVTPDLFRRFPDAGAFADAGQDELEALIRSTGFFRNKAKSLIGVGRAVREQFDGEVPDTMAELLTLPGVARKTANCVLGTWYGKNEGIVVDTHVGRLALRLRLLTSARDDKDALKIERDLMELFPQEAWTYLAHALIRHGREVCRARKPECSSCELARDCPSAGTFG